MIASFRSAIMIAITFALALTACSLVRSTRAIRITMTEEGWSAEPTVVDDANQLEFTFVNNTTEPHAPIVVALDGDEEVDPELIVSRAIVAAREGSDSVLVFPAGDSGRIGHYHPGGPDAPELPKVAVTVVEDGGELIRYLFADTVDPGESPSNSVTAGEAEFTFGMRHPGTRYAVLCMDPAHFGRAEHTIFELSR